MAKVLSFKQELTAVLGHRVAENPTQAMIEAAYLHYGLNWRYLTIEVTRDGLADAVRGARAMGFRGFNCTIPQKVAVIEHLDDVVAVDRDRESEYECAVREGLRIPGPGSA
jgi:shikimate dehydrogenase